MPSSGCSRRPGSKRCTHSSRIRGHKWSNFTVNSTPCRLTLALLFPHRRSVALVAFSVWSGHRWESVRSLILAKTLRNHQLFITFFSLCLLEAAAWYSIRWAAIQGNMFSFYCFCAGEDIMAGEGLLMFIWVPFFWSWWTVCSCSWHSLFVPCFCQITVNNYRQQLPTN